jgi:Mn2+/Fe2+ NRAMP family transporter
MTTLDLEPEEFGLRATFFTMLVLGLADLGNIASEFAGIASALGIFGVSKYVVVPLGAVLVWSVVVHGNYRLVDGFCSSFRCCTLRTRFLRG